MGYNTTMLDTVMLRRGVDVAVKMYRHLARGDTASAVALVDSFDDHPTAMIGLLGNCWLHRPTLCACYDRLYSRTIAAANELNWTEERIQDAMKGL